MSNVTLSIGGRSYTVACAEGEESHVLGLGSLIDSKLTSAMGDMSGQNEARMLLFAALLLADELEEKSNQPPPQPAASPILGQRLGEIALRLENLASRLES